jgi:ATP-binding cassette subfamily B protein
MEGRTTFVIALRLSTIERRIKFLVLENGEIAERGTHDELIKRRGISNSIPIKHAYLLADVYF